MLRPLSAASPPHRGSTWPSSTPIPASSDDHPPKPTCSDTSRSPHPPSTKWCSLSNETASSNASPGSPAASNSSSRLRPSQSYVDTHPNPSNPLCKCTKGLGQRG